MIYSRLTLENSTRIKEFLDRFDSPLTEMDLERIRQIESALPKASAEDLSEQIFQVVLDARLRKVPADIKAQVQEAIAKSKPRFFGSKVESRYFDGRIILNIPDPLRKTAILYQMRIREAEHAIQDLVLKKFRDSPDLAGLFSESTLARAELRFVKEAKAVEAEWEYLHQLKPDLKEELIALISRDRETVGHPSMRDLISSLRASSYELPDYMRIQFSGPKLSYAQTKAPPAKVYPRSSPPETAKAADFVIVGSGVVMVVALLKKNCQKANKPPELQKLCDAWDSLSQK